MRSQVILVDEHDLAIGTAEKMAAHQQGLRHRAFSVFVFFGDGDTSKLLLQQRQQDKYHCPGLWTNTCCSHPQPGEAVIPSAENRLQEEIGIRLPLSKAGEFHYIAHFDNGLTENEYDHVLVGYANNMQTHANPNEVATIQWLDIQTLEQDLIAHPNKYTPWFTKAWEIAKSHLHHHP